MRHALVMAALLAIGGCSAIPVQNGPPVPPGPLGPIVQAEGAGAVLGGGMLRGESLPQAHVLIPERNSVSA